MTKKTPVPALPSQIIETPLTQALGERYLRYAMSTITARSLPDVRDGLKPVHRRLLFAMKQLGLDARSAYKKSARVVGDVMGKFHPHGDAAIYDALVRLAQDFAVRYPLVDGQGNFGNIDGDGAAAARYTEARLTSVAEALLANIDEDTVDFIPTYDGESSEPKLLPSAFPNLLANGASGIAVGMATNIPPHNVVEICAALLHLIRKPQAEISEILEHMQGPDFATGGIVTETPETILETYTQGRGSFRLRARYEIEELKTGYQVVVTEIPYQIQKSKLIEQMADLLSEKKLPLLGDIRDESTEEVRLVLEPKSRTVDPTHLMESLFRATDLESRFHLNMNVLDKHGVPQVMNLKQVLQAFLEHRQEVLVRRSRHRLGKIDHRLEVIEGYIIAYLNLDEVIKIIREEDEPKQIFMERFKLSEVQAEAILNMRLRNLRKLEEMELRAERDKLSQEKADLVELIENTLHQWKTISAEIKHIQKQFGSDTLLGARRTTFILPPQAIIIPLESAIEREDVTVLCSEKGWVRTLKGHVQDSDDIKYKEGDQSKFSLHASTPDKLLIFASNGRMYTIGVDKLPRGRGQGDPLRHWIDLDPHEEILSLHLFKAEKAEVDSFIVAASDGRGFVVAASEVVAQTKGGKQVLNVGDGITAVACHPIQGDHLAVVGENRKLLIFPVSELPVMTRGRGVTLQKYKGSGLSDLKTFNKDEGLTFGSALRTRTVTDLRLWLGKRSQSGRLVPTGFPRNNKFLSEG